MYGWCRYSGFTNHTKGLQKILVDLKYGGRDISESYLVFCCPKDGGAGWRTTTFTIHEQKLKLLFKYNKTKQKCSPVVRER